jgi:hypothetical protein
MQVVRPLSLPGRVLLLVAAAYCFTLFIALHARATDAFFQFLWPIAPPTAAFVGAWFGAIAVAFLVGAGMRGWGEIRGLLGSAMLAAVVLTYAALLDDRFREDEFILGITWYAGLVGFLVLFSLLFLFQELLVTPTIDAPARANAWVRRALLLMAVVIWFFGLLLTITPGILQPRWPWHCLFPGDCLGALPERDTVAMGGVLLATGFALGWGAIEGSRPAVALTGLFGFLAGTISLFGVLRFSEYTDESYWSWLGLVCLQGALIIVSLVAFVMSVGRPRWLSTPSAESQAPVGTAETSTS